MNQPHPRLAILICGALFLVWSILYSRHQQRLIEQKKFQEKQEAENKVRKEAEPAEKAVGAAEGEERGAGKPAAVPRPSRDRKREELRTGDLLRAIFTTRGGGLDQVTLPGFKSSEIPRTDLVLLPENSSQRPPLALRLETLEGWPKEALPALDEEDWEMEIAEAREDSGKVVFRNAIAASPEAPPAGEGAEAGGIAIVKEIHSSADAQHLEVSVSFHNRGAAPTSLRYLLWGPVGIRSESFRSPGSDLRLAWGKVIGGGLPSVSTEKITSIRGTGWSDVKQIVFAGLSNNYFSAILAAADAGGAPAETIEQAFAEVYPEPRSLEALLAKKFPGKLLESLAASERKDLEKKAVQTARVGIRSKEVKIAPGSSVEHHYLFYLGPRQDKDLERYRQLNLTAINDYGWTSWVVKLFLLILKGFHAAFQAVGGGQSIAWGLSIVFLTLLVRLSLHPINRRQQIGMIRYQKKISKIQPQMQEIRERHKDNRIKMQQEMQRLFKEHDVNPAQMMGGCMMIFLQLPIWIGLINTLDYSLDLRQAPFLWIKDLSQPDRLLQIKHSFPYLPNDLNLLPIIYVLLMIVQQKLQPKPEEAQARQTQRMMSIMMIAFGFIFYSFPSGLMVYFITSALFGLFESRYIKRIAARSSPSGSAAVPVAAASMPSGAMYPASKAALKLPKPPKPKPFYRF